MFRDGASTERTFHVRRVRRCSFGFKGFTSLVCFLQDASVWIGIERGSVERVRDPRQGCKCEMVSEEAHIDMEVHVNMEVHVDMEVYVNMEVHIHTSTF